MNRWISHASVTSAALALCMACGDDRPAAPTPEPNVPARTEPKRPTERPKDIPGWIGVTTARKQTDVETKLTGGLLEVYVRQGDPVEEGDRIATIDDGPTKDLIKVAKSELRSARAQRSRTGTAAEAAKRSLERARALFEQGGTSQKAVDDAQFEYATAIANRDAAAAAVSTEKARIDQLKSQLKETTILAPFSGMVSTRYRDPGGLLTPGTPIVRLISADGLWVVFAVPSDEAAGLRVGMPVKVSLEGTEVAVAATVRTVAPEVTSGLQAVIVEAELDPADERTHTLRPNLDVRVKL